MSRGRKAKKNKKVARRPTPPAVFDQPCDCPACSGEDIDPPQLIEAVTAGAAGIVEADDPLDAEILGATFMSISTLASGDIDANLIEGFVPAAEELATPEAMAMLLAIGAVADDRVSKTARTSAERLAAAGVPQPSWAAELSEPVTVTDCCRLTGNPAATILACAFHRAGRSHAMVMTVDHFDCGAASEIFLLDGDRLSPMLRETISNSPGEFTQEPLEPADLRWQFESALDARAVHDADNPALAVAATMFDDDGQPSYYAMATLLRNRLSTIPTPNKPKASHGDCALNGGTIALPAKLTKTGGPAPVYLLKVSLRGSKPPIWRRLEIPADFNLAELHAAIQLAFGWDDSHMHVFETPYGEFGLADAELGFRAESRVTLEQVTPSAQSKIRYRYDFGDSWEHDILVEKVLLREEGVRYPRCTGGRMAAPPEDCGGIWGYAYLTEVLADPDHEEHADRLDWLGLDDAAEFDPAAFDVTTVNQTLARMH